MDGSGSAESVAARSGTPSLRSRHRQGGGGDAARSSATRWGRAAPPPAASWSTHCCSDGAESGGALADRDHLVAVVVRGLDLDLGLHPGRVVGRPGSSKISDSPSTGEVIFSLNASTPATRSQDRVTTPGAGRPPSPLGWSGCCACSSGPASSGRVSR